MVGQEEIQRREAEQARHRENKGRLAFVSQSYSTAGQGVVEFEDRIDFGLIYIEKPWPSWGHELDPDTVAEILATETPAVLPQVTGYITEWDLDDHRNYVGAWVAVGVVFPSPIPVDATISIKHYVSFQGMALKKVPTVFDD